MTQDPGPIADLTLRVLTDIREEMRGVRGEIVEMRGDIVEVRDEVRKLNVRFDPFLPKAEQRKFLTGPHRDQHQDLEVRVERLEAHVFARPRKG
jgi:hypothetical protein